MSFDWEDYLTLARRLSELPEGQPEEEAQLRTAISRAYYLAFRKACNFLRDTDGESILRRAVHRFVRDGFERSDDPIRQKIGQDLGRMEMERNKADYDDDFPNLDRTVKYVLFWAGETGTRLKSL